MPGTSPKKFCKFQSSGWAADPPPTVKCVHSCMMLKTLPAASVNTQRNVTHDLISPPEQPWELENTHIPILQRRKGNSGKLGNLPTGTVGSAGVHPAPCLSGPTP